MEISAPQYRADLEDQIDRLNDLLRDVMDNANKSILDSTMMTGKDGMSMWTEAFNETLNETAIEPQTDMNDTTMYDEQDLSGLLDAEDEEAAIEQLFMSLEDYRSHEMRSEFKQEMDRMEDGLKEFMYEALLQVKEDLETQVDELKTENEILKIAQLSQIWSESQLAQLKAEKDRAEINIKNLRDKAKYANSSTRDKFSLIKNALDEVNADANQTNLDAIEKLMCARDMSPTKLKIHLDNIKNKAINQRGEQVMDSAVKKIKKVNTTIARLEKSFSGESLAMNFAGKSKSRAHKRRMTARFQSKTPQKMRTKDQSKTLKTAKSGIINKSMDLTPKVKEVGLVKETDQLKTEVLSLKSERAINESRRMTQKVHLELNKLWPIEERETSTRRPSIRNQQVLKHISQEQPHPPPPVSKDPQTNKQLRLQLRIAKSTLDTEKQKLVKQATDLAEKERMLLKVTSQTSSSQRSQQVYDIYKVEKRKMMKEKIEMKREREALRRAQKRLGEDAEKLAMAREIVNTKINDIIGKDREIAEQMNNLQTQKNEMAAMLTKLVN